MIAQVEHLLQNVQQIRAADTAFAAILGDGSVVTWGAARLKIFDPVGGLPGWNMFDFSMYWEESSRLTDTW